MATGSTSQEQLASPNPNTGPILKPKIVVIMGATGSGKSKLAIDLASHFPIEIINADSMQVYEGLDVLTNKVPLHERKGVPHHLLGTICPNVEFTAKDFRDSAIPLIDEIWSRNCLPVIVGGTNYYIQALVSQFLLDDHAEGFETNCLLDIPGDNEETDFQFGLPSENCDYTYSRLKELDPVAANRIHPNDQRKIKQYLSLYSRLALDQYVDQRVDLMVSAGLLEEVRDIYESGADYTRGLRQAIGVREFEDFLRNLNSDCQRSSASCPEVFKENIRRITDSNGDDRLIKLVLDEAIEKRRRLSRLQMLFGWNIHFVDVTSCILCASENLWDVNVVEPSVNIIKSFIDKSAEPEATKQEAHTNGNNINKAVAIVNEYQS
ncbi:tRNA dimethylallyltransferase 2 [Phtheirospermum japonicum]|uniref:tRNA dimethylallyltransferase 2 n=1 Tax=Phtheirospermum japonicum TaxID=374723 RepID=A0A830CNC5_9LAMI|nr:tRNA dimethylallyltransferase 2 [Phtheirospermum japonicum]